MFYWLNFNLYHESVMCWVKLEQKYQHGSTVGKVWVCVFVCVEPAPAGSVAD